VYPKSYFPGESSPTAVWIVLIVSAPEESTRKAEGRRVRSWRSGSTGCSSTVVVLFSVRIDEARRLAALDLGMAWREGKSSVSSAESS